MTSAVLLAQLTEPKLMFNDVIFTRSVLEKFERSKILEIYFARLDGRIPEVIPVEQHDIYSIELVVIKNFLLSQHPQDPILQKIFRMMN